MRRGAIGLALAGLLLAGCREQAPQPDTAGAAARSQDGRIIPAFQSSTGAAAVPAAEPAAAATGVRAAAVPTSAPVAAGATLPDGEYACYGSGMQVLAGLGFKVSGGRYTDLDGKNLGTVAVDGGRVIFTDGHMSEIGDGRDYDGKSFRVGSQASCEKW